MRRATLAAVAIGAAALLHAGRAWAPFHLVAIDEVFIGTADCPNAQYVVMRLTGAGMVFINGQDVTTQNADGSEASDFGTFTQVLDNGALGAPFIMGTADAAGLFGIAMDREASGQLVFPDGRVCFGFFQGMAVDCVAYGNFTGDNSGGGAPATAPVRGMALVRQTDTMSDEDDFALGAPAPRNNAGDTGTLGVCPGGVDDTPTPTEGVGLATPTATAVPTGTVAACVGDCNGDGMVGINELILGVNIALELQPISACPAFDCQGTGTVPISCLIQGVSNSLNGCPALAAAAAPPIQRASGPPGARRVAAG